MMHVYGQQAERSLSRLVQFCSFVYAVGMPQIAKYAAKIRSRNAQQYI